MSLVYLAGPITGLTYEQAVGWREEFQRLVGPSIKCLSPMRHKEYLLGETDLKDGYDQHLMSTVRAITTRDRFDCTRCDMLVVNVLGATRPSLGTTMEIAWADLCRTPIVMIMEPGNVHDHGMIRESVGWIVQTPEEAAFVVQRVLGE